jgi:uncharacterized protein (TIGR02001 family)
MRAALLFGSACAALALVARPVAAQDADPVTFSGSAALVSNYTFRGISQTSNEAAIQAGISMEAPSGIYAGIWGSSLNFGESADLVSSAAGGSMELDLIAGIVPSLGPLGVDIGAVYYLYPGSAAFLNYNFWEFALGLSHDFPNFSVGAKGVYSPDYFAGSGTGVYFGGSLGIPIPNTTLSVSASVGHQGIETNDAFGTPDYLDWTAGASVEVLGLTLGATAVGTDLSEADCFGGSDFCKARVLFSVSK